MKWTSEEVKHAMASLEDKVDSHSVEINKLKSKEDATCIAFGGLGFANKKEASAWLMKHMPDYPAGLIMDAHIMLEFVQVYRSNQDTLDKMKCRIAGAGCFRIKIRAVDGYCESHFNAYP